MRTFGILGTGNHDICKIPDGINLRFYEALWADNNRSSGLHQFTSAKPVVLTPSLRSIGGLKKRPSTTTPTTDGNNRRRSPRSSTRGNNKKKAVQQSPPQTKKTKNATVVPKEESTRANFPKYFQLRAL